MEARRPSIEAPDPFPEVPLAPSHGFPLPPALAGAILAALLALPAPAAPQAPSPSDVSGSWDVAISDVEAGDRTGRLALEDRDGILSGRIDWDDGSGLAVSGWRSGADLELRIASFTGIPLLLVGTMSPDGSEMSGTLGADGAWLAVFDAPPPAADPPAGAVAAGPSAAVPGSGAVPPTSGATPDPAVADPLLRAPIGATPGPAPTPVAPGVPAPVAPPVALPNANPAATLPAGPPRIVADDLGDAAGQAVANFADDLGAGAGLEGATRSFAADAVDATAREAGRRVADAAADLGSDALARGVGGATAGAVGAGLRQALDLGAGDATPLEAAGQALADAAVGIAATEARREITEAASDVVADEVADRVGQAAGGVLGQTLGGVGGGLLGGLFGRGGDADDDRDARAPAPGLLSGRWRLVVIDSRGAGTLTHTGTLDLAEKGDDVRATARWSGAAPGFLTGAGLEGERDGLRLSLRADGSGPVFRGVVDGAGRRMGGYVSAGGFVGLWQATR